LWKFGILDEGNKDIEVYAWHSLCGGGAWRLKGVVNTFQGIGALHNGVDVEKRIADA